MNKFFQLAKGVVYLGDNQKELFELYDTYLEDKNDIIKAAFNNYTGKKRVDYVTERMHKVLGYYLTKDQIKRMEGVLEQEDGKTKSTQDLIAAVEKEVAKDIGEKKAKTAVENAMKELRLLGKHHVGFLEKANKHFFSLIRHDEL
ncbi:hypothetical protein COOONC_17342 [Cooperia oncophora]